MKLASRSDSLLIVALLMASAILGCESKQAVPPRQNETAQAEPSPKPSSAESAPETFEPQVYSVSADELLSARLPAEETSQGWVRLFDGQSLFGWEITGEANFRVEDDTIIVDRGKQCLMCSSSTWGDFELKLEFNADAETNSGVFVRTPLDPTNVTDECYEINIAPDDNPFPTGSIVQREKVNPQAAGAQTPGKWRSMTIRAEGRDVTVHLGDTLVCSYTDPADLAARRIGLQHNSGRVAFRDIRIRPLGLDPLLDKDLSRWKRYPEMPGEFTINEDGDLRVKGGLAQLETNESYGDFFLLAQYKIEDPTTNSGLFFRCIPGDKLMGYECQVNNAFNDSRLAPADCGTGGIFRRQDARVVAGEDGQWSTVLLHANRNKIGAWVNGLAVSDWEDTRKTDENPRRGRRDEPGTIMIQAHDPKTDLLFRGMKISEIK
ncbi:MAG: DUF1080 domain-containing protein [Planctomycetota bacterium]